MKIPNAVWWAIGLGAAYLFARRYLGGAAGAAVQAIENVRQDAASAIADVFVRQPNMDPGASYPISNGAGQRKSWPPEKVLPAGFAPDGDWALQHYDAGANVFRRTPIA